jgi:hypothetical protein
MRVTLENHYPVNSTLFLLPAIALRGFNCGPRVVVFAWWKWRVVIRFEPGSEVTR